MRENEIFRNTQIYFKTHKYIGLKYSGLKKPVNSIHTCKIPCRIRMASKPPRRHDWVCVLLRRTQVK